MRGVRTCVVAIGLGALLVPAVARGQGAITFQPIISTLPDGVTLNVTPVVSADRRYVRMTINPVFSDVIQIDNFLIPGIVAGTNFGGGGLGGLGGGLGGGGGGGVGGGFGNGGFASIAVEPTAYHADPLPMAVTPSARSRAYARFVASRTRQRAPGPASARRRGR